MSPKEFAMSRKHWLFISLLPLAGVLAGATNLVCFGLPFGFEGWDWYVWPSAICCGAAVGLVAVPLFRSDHVAAMISRRAVVGGVFGLLIFAFLLCVIPGFVLPKVLGISLRTSGVTPGGGDAYGPIVFALANIVGCVAGLLFGPVAPYIWQFVRRKWKGQTQ